MRKIEGWIAEQLIEEMQPYDLTGDLTDYCEAIGAMSESLLFWISDRDVYVGWQGLFDVDLEPTYGLPWLAQIVGERFSQPITDAEAREQIRKTPNQYRGTVMSIVHSVQKELTGAKRVWLRERYNGVASEADENWISVATYASETPSEQAILNAFRRSVPADINIFYEALTGTTWGELETPTKTWTVFEADYGPTWANVAEAQPEGLFYEA